MYSVSSSGLRAFWLSTPHNMPTARPAVALQFWKKWNSVKGTFVLWIYGARRSKGYHISHYLSWTESNQVCCFQTLNAVLPRISFQIISGCWHVKGKHNYLWIIIFLFIKHWLESTPITYLSEPQDKWQLYIRKCTLVVMGYYGRWLDIQLPRWTSWRSKSWSAARTGYI